MIRLAGLHRRTSRSGKTYYSGRLGAVQLLLFPNRKTSGRHPDVELYIAPLEPGGGDLSDDERREFERLLARDEINNGR